MVRAAISNQIFNLSNLIIASVLYFKSAAKLLIFHWKMDKITHLHARNEGNSQFLCNFVAK